MKTITKLLLFFTLTALIVSCAEDPLDAVIYKVTIKNEAGNDQDVYLKSDLDNTGYVAQGTVVDGGTKEINGLLISVNYTFGFIAKGGDPANINNTIDVTNNDPSRLDYLITIKP